MCGVAENNDLLQARVPSSFALSTRKYLRSRGLFDTKVLIPLIPTNHHSARPDYRSSLAQSSCWVICWCLRDGGEVV